MGLRHPTAGSFAEKRPAHSRPKRKSPCACTIFLFVLGKKPQLSHEMWGAGVDTLTVDTHSPPTYVESEKVNGYRVSTVSIFTFPLHIHRYTDCRYASPPYIYGKLKSEWVSGVDSRYNYPPLHIHRYTDCPYPLFHFRTHFVVRFVPMTYRCYGLKKWI